jgi:hypothetical protein
MARTLATFMSIQQPIEEKRLSEALKPLDSEQHSTLRDPDETFDRFLMSFGRDRYELYKQFVQADGDLLYLIWLEGILLVGDDLVESIREDVRSGTREAQLTKQFLAFINSPFLGYVGEWIVLKTAQSIENSFPDFEPSFPSNEWLEKTGDTIVHEACLGAFAYHLYNSKPEKQKRVQKALRDFMLDGTHGSPLRELLWEYAVAPELTPREKGGKPPDYWGTFFLMVLSDHLREDNKHPRYKLCGDLLNLFRDDHKKGSDSLIQTKIRQLKDSHPNWRKHLSLLRQTFLKFLSARLSINPKSG